MDNHQKSLSNRVRYAYSLLSKAMSNGLDETSDIAVSINKIHQKSELGVSLTDNDEQVLDDAIKKLIDFIYSNQGIVNKADSIEKRIQRAYKLLKYAINNNLQLSDDVISSIEELYYQSLDHTLLDSSHAVKLDIAIRELTKVTFPTTINTIQYTQESFIGKISQSLLVIITAVTICCGVYFYYLSTNYKDEYYKIIISICMGILGAQLSIFFYFFGLKKELALDEGDIPKQFARIVLGAVVGYIGYIILTDNSLDLLKNTDSGKLKNSFMLLPLLMGYSVRLVFGILNKAIKAVELTLGLEDKADDLALRGKQNS